MIKEIKKQPITNLKGIIVGNGATDFQVDVSPSFPQTIFGMSLITKNIMKKYQDNKCFFSFRHVLPESKSPECLDAWNLMNKLTAGLNWYDLYQPASHNSFVVTSEEDRYGEVMVEGELKRYKRGKTVQEYTPWI